MRDILVDHLRRQPTLKRGGTRIRVDLENANPHVEPRDVDFLVLDEALRRLAAIKARYTQIVELRYLAGLTIAQTAEALKVSHATIEREWTFARGWLRRELNPRRGGHSERGSAQP